MPYYVANFVFADSDSGSPSGSDSDADDAQSRGIESKEFGKS